MIPKEARERADHLRGQGAAYYAYVFMFAILAIIAVWLAIDPKEPGGRVSPILAALLTGATLVCLALGMRKYRDAKRIEEEARRRVAAGESSGPPDSTGRAS